MDGTPAGSGGVKPTSNSNVCTQLRASDTQQPAASRTRMSPVRNQSGNIDREDSPGGHRLPSSEHCAAIFAGDDPGIRSLPVHPRCARRPDGRGPGPPRRPPGRRMTAFRSYFVESGIRVHTAGEAFEGLVCGFRPDSWPGVREGASSTPPTGCPRRSRPCFGQAAADNDLPVRCGGWCTSASPEPRCRPPRRQAHGAGPAGRRLRASIRLTRT